MPKLSKPETIETKCRVCSATFVYNRNTKPRILCDKHQFTRGGSSDYQKRYYIERLKGRRQASHS